MLKHIDISHNEIAATWVIFAFTERGIMVWRLRRAKARSTFVVG